MSPDGHMTRESLMITMVLRANGRTDLNLFEMEDAVLTAPRFGERYEFHRNWWCLDDVLIPASYSMSI